MIQKLKPIIPQDSLISLLHRLIWQKTTAPRCSHVLSNRSTRRALRSLTLEIERDPVRSTRCGRS